MIDDPELPPSGISLIGEAEARWCVWAPKARRVELMLGSGATALATPMEPIGRGYHAAVAGRPAAGSRYAFRLDGEAVLADPWSRWQPDGVDAPSAAWFPEPHTWNEGGWEGIARADLVFYEVHVGTFTAEGTFDAVIPRLESLKGLGITAIELMPVGQFAGTRSWGYDGVFPFAVQHSYGGPDGLRRLVEGCHRLGLAIFLDVIYNHFGPEGNVFPSFGDYMTDRYRTDWGPALNFDGKGSDSVRAFVVENARQWIRDFRFDGLRVDAADQIYDRGPRHILADLADAVHLEADRLGRPAHVFAETDLNDAPRFLHEPSRGGYGLDGHWNDDFHHAAHVTLSGESGGYYSDFQPGPHALARALERVFVNDGNFSPFRQRRHGTAAIEFPGDRFVAFTQNHDQVGNRLKSDRNAAMLHPAATRLAAGILLLSPRLPLLFMGEEYGETRPFPFFGDFKGPDLVRAVRDGRKAEFAYFGWDQEPADPFSPATRESAILSWDWSDPRRLGLRRLYHDLFRLRRETPALRPTTPARARLHEGGPPGPILEVGRGSGGDDLRGPLRIVFNLGDEAVPLATGDADGPPWFRSEAECYGGKVRDRDAWDGRALPREFLIFGGR